MYSISPGLDNSHLSDTFTYVHEQHRQRRRMPSIFRRGIALPGGCPADPGRTCAVCNVLLMYEAQGSAATELHLCLVSFVFMHAALLAGQCCKLL